MTFLAALKADSFGTFFVVVLSKTDDAFFSDHIFKAIFGDVAFLSASETFDDPVFLFFLFYLVEISEIVHLR